MQAALVATPEERRPWVAVSTVARTIEPGMSLPAGIEGEPLVRAMTEVPAHEYLLVEDDGSIYGVLSTADVERAFREARGGRSSLSETRSTLRSRPGIVQLR